MVLIDGVQYRAFPETALRQLAEQTVELDSARSEIINLRQQLEKSTDMEAALKSQIELSLKSQTLLENQIAKLTETVAGLDANNKKLDTLIKEATAPPGFWNSWKGKLTLSAIQIGGSFAVDRLIHSQRLSQ